MSTDSHFTNEPEGIVMDEHDEWYWLHNAALGERRLDGKQKWWKRPRVFYTSLCLIVAAILGLIVTGTIMGLDGMSGWRPNRGGSDPLSDVAANENDGNVQGTGGFMTHEPSPSPTFAPSASPTEAPTEAPTLGPRTIPLSFYVIGDGTYRSFDIKTCSNGLVRCFQ